MRFRLFLLLLIVLVGHSAQNVFGQQICQTFNETSNNYLNKSAFLRTQNNSDSYCLKVYFHVIRRINGTGGQSVLAVNEAFEILNHDFSPHNISFSWDNSIDYIDSTVFYNNPNYGMTFDANGMVDPPLIFTTNNHQDGIDIYLFDDSVNYGGLAYNVGFSSEFYVSGSFWESPFQSLTTSHIISHEMGHVLFLWHTHHGTAEAGSDNPCPELVDGSNSGICGDYVADTPADPYIDFDVDSNCQWLGSGIDANGDSYDPDEQNIMAYTTPQCMSYFTELQGLRMRNAIASLPFLQQTLVECCNGEDSLDLYIKDSPDDDGTEPNSVTEHMWRSQDIWVRNFDDGGLTHQNPEYRTNGMPNYIYVRVVNTSCETSLGEEILTINWAKANTALMWPQNWDGGIQNSGGFDLGGELPTVIIPVILPGEEAIIKVPWVVPNPNNYSDNDNPWHFCLLARIDSDLDPMGAYTSNPNVMVRNNNNQAWKNITIVDLVSDFTSGSVLIANPHNIPKTYYLEMQKETNEEGKAIFDEAEVTLKMDDVLYAAWERGGKIAQELDPTQEEKRKIVKGNNVILDNISFNANEMGLLTLDFNFLTEEITDKEQYTYHVIQRDTDTGEIIGGETYIIRKEDRPLFLADAGDDKEVDLNETITISAEDINEPAVYNWYDEEGNLIFQGQDLTVTAEIVEKYKLEVIAVSDGFKDYAEVEVTIKPSEINSISPNPAYDSMVVNYKINNATSAYLMVFGTNGSNTSNNYILDINQEQTQIDLTGYQVGYYTVALICDGEIIDAKILIKQ